MSVLLLGVASGCMVVAFRHHPNLNAKNWTTVAPVLVAASTGSGVTGSVWSVNIFNSLYIKNVLSPLQSDSSSLASLEASFTSYTTNTIHGFCLHSITV